VFGNRNNRWSRWCTYKIYWQGKLDSESSTSRNCRCLCYEAVVVCVILLQFLSQLILLQAVDCSLHISLLFLTNFWKRMFHYNHYSISTQPPPFIISAANVSSPVTDWAVWPVPIENYLWNYKSVQHLLRLPGQVISPLQSLYLHGAAQHRRKRTIIHDCQANVSLLNNQRKHRTECWFPTKWHYAQS
jgi:hypothetical protein